MSDPSALKAAIELLHMPSQVRTMRSSPLPKGTPLLLRLAAGETEAALEAQELVGRPPEVSREAAIFFIEQILLSSDADSYRILGLDHTANGRELRTHMALLLKWLHPDLNRDGHKTLLARRVIRAWDQIKTPERRRHHDEIFELAPEDAEPRRGRKPSRIAARSKARALRRTSDAKKATSHRSDQRATRVATKHRRLRSVFGFFFRFARVARHPNGG